MKPNGLNRQSYLKFRLNRKIKAEHFSATTDSDRGSLWLKIWIDQVCKRFIRDIISQQRIVEEKF